MARRRLLEDAAADEMTKYAAKGAGISRSRGRQVFETSDAGGEVLGDRERNHHVKRPGRGEIGKRADVDRSGRNMVGRGHRKSLSLEPAIAVDREQSHENPRD